jgi:hypothetical protein
VAVGAQEPKVFKPVVVPIAVDMVKRHRERLSSPLDQSTDFTATVLDPCRDETSLDVEATARTVGDQ